MLTDTFIPSGELAFISATFCRISFSDLGALIRVAPKYVTPLKIVHSWSMSDSSSSVSVGLTGLARQS